MLFIKWILSLCLAPWPVYALQREEFEVIVFVEPGALEHFEWQSSSSAQGECIDGELDVSVPFPSGFGLVVEDVEVAVADLKKIDVAGDGVAIEREIESAAPVVREIVACEVDRDFDRNGHGIVDEHEAL